MIEIFIPVKIKGYRDINNISDTFLSIIKANFTSLEIINFKSVFFEGIVLKMDTFSQDLIILCNGEFGENYFVNFDFLEHKFNFLGTKIVGENKIGERVGNIMNNISKITDILKSDNLLTFSKKEEIKNKIDFSFFALAGVVFLLYSLKEETIKNLDELKKVKGKVDFEGQAMLLAEISKTKQIELQASIDKLEGRVDLFIFAIKSLI